MNMSYLTISLFFCMTALVFESNRAAKSPKHKLRKWMATFGKNDAKWIHYLQQNNRVFHLISSETGISCPEKLATSGAENERSTCPWVHVIRNSLHLFPEWEGHVYPRRIHDIRCLGIRTEGCCGYNIGSKFICEKRTVWKPILVGGYECRKRHSKRCVWERALVAVGIACGCAVAESL